VPERDRPRFKLDGFLKVPDIPGSVEGVHEKEIEIHAISFEMDAPHDPTSLSRRGGVAIEPFKVYKYYDMASPYLKQALFNNTKLDEVVFSANRTIEGESADYLVVTLTNASVDSYRVRMSEDEPDKLEEEVGFIFHAIKFVYDKDYEAEINVRVGGPA
jgi:type VI secretion system secreted protein Hcp